MLRANVYSLEPLPPDTREAVHDGIGMVATYMGETVATRELIVRLPQLPDGLVNPRRVGFGKLDKMVELHLMALPLDPLDAHQLGLAHMGEGHALVDVSSDSTSVIRLVTAHESAHAFGYVLPDTVHRNPASYGHCSDATCMMHPRVQTIAEEMSPVVALQHDSGQTSYSLNMEPKVALRVYQQHDFCLPCKSDMRQFGGELVSKLRYERVFGHAQHC